jgi:hypothetical protein
VNHWVLKLVALLGLAALGSGCAGMAAYPISAASSLLSPAGAIEIHNQTEVRIDQDNFVIVKTNAAGKAKGFSLFGFITLAPAKFSTALNRCYGQAALEAGKPQMLINVVMEKNTSYWILFARPEVSVRGDVVEFVPVEPSADESPTEPMRIKRTRQPPLNLRRDVDSPDPPPRRL